MDWRGKRDEIYKRDRCMCQLCIRQRYTLDRMRQYEYNNIQVHHIEPLAEAYSLRLDNSNLISLCPTHHDMAEKGKIPKGELLAIVREQEGTPVSYTHLTLPTKRIV